jgi:hypothetical protein
MSFRFRAFDEGPHSAARHGTARGGSPGVRARALRGGARGRPERRVHRVQRDDAARLERHRVSNIRGGHRRWITRRHIPTNCAVLPRVRVRARRPVHRVRVSPRGGSPGAGRDRQLRRARSPVRARARPARCRVAERSAERGRAARRARRRLRRGGRPPISSSPPRHTTSGATGTPSSARWPSATWPSSSESCVCPCWSRCGDRRASPALAEKLPFALATAETPKKTALADVDDAGGGGNMLRGARSLAGGT